MSKEKSITLLTIIGILLAVVMALTVVRFPLGEVKYYDPALTAIELDYDMEGGYAYTLKLSEDNEEDVEDIEQVIDTLEYRLTALGYSTYSVKAIKSTDKDVLDYDIRIEAKNTESLSSDIAVVMAYGEVAFFGGTSANPTTQILEDEVVVKGAKYEGAQSDGNTVYYQASITFTEKAYSYLVDEMRAASDAGNSYYLEIKLGDTVLLSGSSAISESYFNNRALFITSSSEASAKQMALQVSSGGLKYMYEIDSQGAITSPYGENVANVSLIAVSALLVIILAALVIMYKGFGWVSALSTLMFILAEIWMLVAIPGIVLSLGGVIGIALAIILCAYSMIITASRIKEEYSHSEKTAKAAINKGFKSSLIPVIAVNLIAGIFALAMFIFTSGTLKCFAITLGIGAVISAIAALVFTRMFTTLILAIVKDKEKFLNAKKVEA